MPDHATWFTFLLPNFEENLARFREAMGLSFYGKAPVEIQYVIGYAFISLLILGLVFVARRRWADTKEAFMPEGKFNLPSFFEAMIEGALSLMGSIMDRKAALYFVPLIGTCAFFILFSNLIGLVPGFLPPTSNLNTTLAMAVVIFLTTHIYGVKEHGFIKYFAHWMGPIRSIWALPLMLLMFAIEIVSHLARPASLSVRLMGNMAADHMVVATFIGLVPLLVPLPIMILGVMVCIVQTLVFCILSTVYIGMAVAHEEHD